MINTMLGFGAACACPSQMMATSVVMIFFIFYSRLSGNEVFNHLAAELTELLVATGVKVGELVVIQAK